MKNKLFILILSLLCVFILYLIITYITTVHVKAQFEELEPFKSRLSVYYKGFRLGRTGRVYPCDNYQKTCVELHLHAKDTKFPTNITAKLKSKDLGDKKVDYIEIIYPDSPNIANIKNNSIIQGEKSQGIGDYINSQAESGGLDEIKENLNTTVKSAGQTLDALTEFIHIGTDILTDLRPSLKESGENLALTTKNFANMSQKLNNSIETKTFTSTFKNLEKSSYNLTQTTQNFTTLSDRANKQTVCLLNNLLTNLNTVVLNVLDIVKGFKSTLSKNFSGFRIMFGKSVS